MNIFEQLEAAEFMLLFGDTITTNFGWNPDDPEEDWCLSIYGYGGDGGYYELYFTHDDMEKASRYNDGWMVAGTKVEFCLITHVTSIPTRRDKLVAAAIEHRGIMNEIIRNNSIETDPDKLELVGMQIKYLQQFLNELEEEISKIDFPNRL